MPRFVDTLPRLLLGVCKIYQNGKLGIDFPGIRCIIYSERTHRERPPMFKFTNEKLAESFRDRATKTMVIILGDDGRFWVCTGREAKRLVAAGYQERR